MEKTPISTREAAKILGVTPKTVIRLVERNEISGWRVGDVWRFNREDIEEYKEHQTRGKPSDKREQQSVAERPEEEGR